MPRASTGRPAASGPGRPGRNPPAESGRRPPPPGPHAGRAVADLVAGPLAEAGFDLEDVDVTRAGSRYVLAIAVDRDGGLDLDVVAEASRVVSDVLDARDADLPAALRDAYTLEVSSRGATAPLTLPRHWRRAIGRLVEVRRRDAAPVTGRVRSADGTGADLDVDGDTLRIELDDVVRAVVQLEFRRPGAADDLGDPADDPADDTDDGDGEETP